MNPKSIKAGRVVYSRKRFIIDLILLCLIFLSLLIYAFQIPHTRSYFTDNKTADRITLTVTGDKNRILSEIDIFLIEDLTGEVVELAAATDRKDDITGLADIADVSKITNTADIEDKISDEATGDSIDKNFHQVEKILITVELGNGYNGTQIDTSTVEVTYKELSIPYEAISLDSELVKINLDYETVLSITGYGVHDLNVTGMLMDGWTEFYGTNSLELIDYEPVSEGSEEDQDMERTIADEDLAEDVNQGQRFEEEMPNSSNDEQSSENLQDIEEIESND